MTPGVWRVSTRFWTVGVPTAFIFNRKSSRLHGVAFQKIVIFKVSTILEHDAIKLNWGVPSHII
jgi:hypothetical protein